LALWKWVNQAKATDTNNLPQGFAEYQEKIRAMPRQVGQTFSATAYIDNAWQLVGVPYIDTTTITLLPQDDLLRHQFTAALADYPKDAPMSYSKAWEWLGKPSMLRVNNNVEYRVFKEVFDALKEARRETPPKLEQEEASA
jgi:hypothetical protein